MSNHYYEKVSIRRRPSNNAITGGVYQSLMRYMEGLEKEIAAVGALIGYMACERRYHHSTLGEKIKQCFAPVASESPFTHEGPRLRLVSVKRRST